MSWQRKMAAKRKQTSATVPCFGESKETKSLLFELDPTLPVTSMEDRVQYVDRELRKLQAFCLQSGYTAAQIEGFAGCFRESSAIAQLQKWKRKGFCLVFMAVVALLLYNFNPACRLANATARAAIMKVLPLWDWTVLYENTCLVANPLYTNPNTLMADDCQICESVQKIMRVRNLSPANVVEEYFKTDKPLIVEDEIPDWDSLPFTSIQELAQVYEDDEALSLYGGCSFSSNLRMRHSGHRDLLHAVRRENISSFYAHWENCQLTTAKAFRFFYKRPYFLPSSVETSSTNWVFISLDYDGKIFKEVPVRHPLVILMQIVGQMDIQVLPRSPCAQICTSLNDTLHAVVVTDFLWKTAYLPGKNEENMAIGIGGNFD